MKKKIIRITTVPISLAVLLKGQLKYMSNHYEVIGVSSFGREIALVEDQENIETHVIEMTRQISPLKDLISAYKLFKFIKKEKPFIVHTHTPKAGTLGMLAARLAGVSNRLHTVAGMPLLEATGAKRQLLNIVEKVTYANATLVLPNSYGLKKIIKDLNFTTEKRLRIIGNGSSNGIDTDYFNKSNINLSQRYNLMQQLSIVQEDFVFVYVGRLVADKGINELVSAFNSISKTYNKIKLLLVGPLETELDPLNNQTILIIESNKNIITVGWQSDVRPYLAISNALVFPSYREGFPNVVMQACAMELACIVTDINGCNEIITNNKNGLVIQPKSIEALQYAMQFFIDNPVKTSEFASVARPNILENYKREVIWNELLNLYKSLET
ncbi:glycosyltransferase family 4 protein [Gelidibacter japonicus]|uniref:glycosyltransferase family 4 protein n=1 Tax=Gelidibacter japonicus TaxID=1962232 RepID=UPI0019662FE9|nr:glycosyltransferase family 4 protein [Gelidibacter japonicus]MCL8006002.1 glycosyltransferase family 4 protein [Gelidibacter japonicus]